MFRKSSSGWSKDPHEYCHVDLRMVERKNVFHFPHVSDRILLGPKICTASDKVFVATVKEAAPIGTGGL